MGQGSSRLGESGTDPAQEAACSSMIDLRTGRVSTLYCSLKTKQSANLRWESAVTQWAVHGAGGGGAAVAGSLPASCLSPEPG